MYIRWEHLLAKPKQGKVFEYEERSNKFSFYVQARNNDFIFGWGIQNSNKILEVWNNKTNNKFVYICLCRAIIKY